MLDGLIRFSLRYRTLVAVVSLGALIYGGYLATQMPIDVFPDLDRPRVVILAECAGMSPEEVETLVTQPIESAVLGATGVEAVRSQSSPGLVVIYIEFGWESDIRAARQVVQERLTVVAPSLPAGIRPLLAPPASIMGQILHVGVHRQRGPGGGELAEIPETELLAERLTGAQGESTLAVWRPIDRHDLQSWEAISVQQVAWHPAPQPAAATPTAATPTASGDPTVEMRATFTIEGQPRNALFASPLRRQMELRTAADWIVRPRLLKISGVAEVIVLGGERKQYQASVDPDAMLAHGVSLAEVEQALRDNNVNASGGFTLEGQSERPIRVIGRLGQPSTDVVRELGDVAVKRRPDRNVLLSHVAEVSEAARPKRGDAAIDGSPGVVLTIVKQPHVDTRGLTERIHAALADVEPSLPGDMIVNRQLFQLKNFIDRGIYYVGEALALGALLVLIVLALFLLNFRTTFITLTAIPMSLAITALTFRTVGRMMGAELSINVMTLGGLAVAMGELVDDAIVDVENIFRRLRENHALPEPRPALVVVYEASREIRGAIVFGTMVVILVFLPLFAMSGVEGRLFAPLGIAYIISILASLLVSLTVTPVLSYYLLPASIAAHRAHDGWLLRSLKRLAAPLVRFSMKRAGILLACVWLCVAACGLLFANLGTDFLPQFDEGSIQINVSLPAGSSLAASNEAASAIDARLARLLVKPDNPNGEILHFVRRTGRAELDEHAQAVGASEYLLSMNPNAARDREEMLSQLLTELKEELPGVDIEAEQPLAHLISHMLSGVSAQVAIKVYGDDLDVLQRVANQIKQEIKDVPGLTAPVIESQLHVDELHVVLDPDALAHYGLSRAYVADFVQTALQGAVVSQVLEGSRRFDLVVRFAEPYSTDYSRLGRLRVDLPDGRQAPLSDLAQLPAGATGPNQLMREDVRRRMVIRCNTLGRDLGSVVADIERRVAGRIEMPPGCFVEYGGQFESQRSASLAIGLLAFASLAGVFVVLLVLFPSVRIVAQILNAVPTAFIGGVLALAITGQTLTVASLVGFVSLGGIAVRNGILLVTHYFHLMREEGEGFSEHLVLRGSLERLAPVLMTALTAGIALAPIVFGGHKPGLEILYPVATVILGGLITSTFCEFLIHPGLFWKFSGRKAVVSGSSEQLQSAPLV